MQTETCLHITQGRSCYSHSTMNGLCSTAPLDLHNTQRIHTAWKSRIHDFMQSPLPWRKIYRQATNETSLLGESLETLLSHKRGQIVFRDFLKSEFCEENLDFWLACQEYKTHESPEKLRWRAENIYEEFITAESPKQVNLDFSTRDAISRSLQQPTASCFVAAQKKVYSLMENGSFQRFIHSEQYKVLSDAALKQKGLRKHRKALKTKSTGDLLQPDSKAILLQRDLHLWHGD
ncbi:regulator of G-protein signaling 21-like isoform X2 [Sphaeramia orbicularis]|uniref:regulator of G-protein signaling 21-like isoform X2 n=1 Tax=Sphaeramia orbicularis TaxID=375764 RepID=UPI00117F194A|nr:regulator of G-protein signaling 21-like isoform X2 [Sphaeramia orbicularis]